MKFDNENLILSGQVVLIFVCAAILYFFVGAYDFPITEVMRD